MSNSIDGISEEAAHGQSRPGGQHVDERLADETNTVVDALLSHAVDVRGKSRNLTRRVADRADRIAGEMKLPDEQRSIIRKAAVLRDVGKAGVPDTILKKSGPLTAREFDEVRARMVPEGDIDDNERVREAIRVAHHHHERVDGQGYPDGLLGDQIPLGSRILAVAEAYETMLVDAPWRAARNPTEALKEMQALSSSQFDGGVVKALAKTVSSAADSDEGTDSGESTREGSR